MGGSSFFGRRSSTPAPFLRSSEEEFPPPSPSFVVFRRRKSHPLTLLRSSEEEVPPPPPFFRPIVDPFFGAEDRRWGFFDLRLRRSKIQYGGILRSSAPKIEDRGPLIFGSEKRRKKRGSSKNLPSLKNPPSSKNSPLLRRLPSSFCVLQARRSKNTSPSSIFRAEDWVEDRRGPRGGIEDTSHARLSIRTNKRNPM